MSKYNAKGAAVTINDIVAAKGQQKISMVTCYDSSFARLVDASSVEVVLVGDSLGNVMMGYEDPIPVTISDMIHHTACVSRVLKRPFLVADMPFCSYRLSDEQALLNASRLVQEGGAQAVKLEGGVEIASQVQAITRAGIPVVGHLGLTPQSVHAMGGYKVQGRGDTAERLLLDNAQALADAGAFCLVLELIPAALAKKVTEKISIPTIGIGAGADCDGQVLVLQDLLGFDESFQPKFLKRYAQLGETIVGALNQYDGDVKANAFPTADNSF